MATGKTCFPRQNYRFLPGVDHHAAVSPADSAFELDESDLYFSADTPEFRKPVRTGRKPSRGDMTDRPRASTPSSLPVSIPDWSKILREEHRDNRRRVDSLDNGFDEDDDDEDDEAENVGSGKRLPPHEFLARQMARTRIGSFSVHEGVGRTLKGRDLSRLRNAIWARTGFED